MSTSTRPPHLNVTEALPRIVGRLALRPLPIPERLAKQLPRIIEPLASLPPVRRIASRMVINYYSYATSLRPRALTMEHDYTTWTSLTDRTFTGRHLPPADPGFIAALPSPGGGGRPCSGGDQDRQVDRHQRDCSCSSPSGSPTASCGPIAWTTARTPRPRRSTCARSTGSARPTTAMLRSMQDGRLKSQDDRRRRSTRPFLFERTGPGEPVRQAGVRGPARRASSCST